MNITTLPTAPNILASIDGRPLGALTSFTERCEQDLTLIRGLGSSENRMYNRNGKRFIIELEYILPLDCLLVDAPADPVSLTSFVLMVFLPNRTLRFTECVYESVQTSCSVGGSLACKMRILARTRQCEEETG